MDFARKIALIEPEQRSRNRRGAEMIAALLLLLREHAAYMCGLNAASVNLCAEKTCAYNRGNRNAYL